MLLKRSILDNWVENYREYGIVTLRNEVGENPSDCYVRFGTMGAAEFAAWVKAPAPEANE